MSESNRTLLIAGCGYLGLQIARVFSESGWLVCGLTRSPESAGDAARLAGIQMVTADLGDPAALAAARERLPKLSAVVHAASSSKGGPEAYRKVFIEGLANLHAIFGPARLLFTSSTSVYGQTQGETVDESSATEPGSETSRLLLEAEKVALRDGGVVARLVGLYGPDRSVVLRKFFQGTAVIEDGGTRILNQIHRDDAARSVFHLLAQAPDAHGIYNVADNHPLEQKEIYARLAASFSLPLPPEAPRQEGRKRGWTSKAVSNARLRALGWSPMFPSFFDAIAHDPALVASIQAQVAAGNRVAGADFGAGG